MSKYVDTVVQESQDEVRVQSDHNGVMICADQSGDTVCISWACVQALVKALQDAVRANSGPAK